MSITIQLKVWISDNSRIAPEYKLVFFDPEKWITQETKNMINKLVLIANKLIVAQRSAKYTWKCLIRPAKELDKPKFRLGFK